MPPVDITKDYYWMWEPLLLTHVSHDCSHYMEPCYCMNCAKNKNKKLNRPFSQQEGANNNIFRNPAVNTTGIVYAGLLAWFTGRRQKSKAIIHFIKYTSASPAKCLIWKYLRPMHFNFLNLCFNIQQDDIIHDSCSEWSPFILIECIFHLFYILSVQRYRTHFVIFILNQTQGSHLPARDPVSYHVFNRA